MAALAVLAILPALFPPWTGDFSYKGFRHEQSLRRSFLFARPLGSNGLVYLDHFGLLKSVRIDLTRLLVEEAVAASLAAGLMYALRRR